MYIILNYIRTKIIATCVTLIVKEKCNFRENTVFFRLVDSLLVNFVVYFVTLRNLVSGYLHRLLRVEKIIW